MFKTLRFVVTDDHLKLMRRMIVGWDGGEYGAPAIDCKRPYGNSSVENDMHEILTGESIGTTKSTRDELTEAECERYRRLHLETETALQIVLAVGAFEAGTYEVEEYRRNWVRVS